ncbi:chemotaxis protein [Klebsiella pneumoniae]|uniref:Chemotaxis protein n=2 Tax=Enterobacteriaceae TaxID=543 RepID=A0AAW8A952_KLEPN|nr:chemotaxis protein [Klebsiella pneumoniae]MBX4637832.1 chemotaxis protein [Klebsiella pneumoniae]MBX4764321.1 chemotaxis protein [Klebsiella pneumoniae]MDP0966023.1 chemotaxis protein [Klebsiella pneumoniae]MDZ1369699.1 chemotaxis protein [Klebsiella pneumoniae]MEA4233255.1 chemotaxis protein [Klebsiella pneumoniae]
MSGTNKIVTSTVNEISWITDDASYQKAKKKIISLKAAHEKPAKALEKAQKRTAQSEGKSALAAAKAQTAKLRQAEQLSKQQQKQAQIQAKMERDAVAHANKMTSLQARQLSQQEQATRQSARLAAISAKVQAAARSRAMTYNPNMPGVHSDPSLVARQTEAMNRGHGAVAADIAATKKAMALEEKRQREKEAAFKRQITAHDTLRRASLTISHIEAASLADKMKAVQAIKEATKGYAEQRYTIAEMRHELAKATLETRRQARINRQIVKDKAKAERAGRINAQRLTRERSERGYGGLAATGVIAGGSLIGSMGVARVGQTLQGSVERNQQMKTLQSQGISRLEYEAVRDVVANKTGFNISTDKMLDFQADYRDKVGQLTANGIWKTDKSGKATLSGGGELGDLINAIAGKSNAATAKRVIKELDKLDFNTAMVYLAQLSRQFKFSSKETAAFAESINDASKVLPAFVDGGDAVQKRMDDLARNGYALSDAQQEQLNRLGALSVEYSRINDSLSDIFSSGFADGLGEVGKNTSSFSKGMAGLVPIMDSLGKAVGQATADMLLFAGRVGQRVNEGATLPDAVYNTVVDDSANSTADWIKQKTGFDPRSIGQTLKQIYPWLDSSAPSNIGSGTAYNDPALALNVPSLNYLTPQQPTFTVPTIDSMTQRQPIPVAVTGEAEIKLSPLDINVNDGAINGLIDTKINDNNVRQQNMLLGIAD